MTKEELKALELSDEHVGKIWNMFDGKYIPKHRFDEINSELKNAKEALKERDSQLETLKKSSGDVDGLRKQIETLQIENETKDETHAAEIKTLKTESAVTSALTMSGAKNAKAVRALLDLDNVELNDDGTIKGLSEQIKKLTENADTKFLFDVDTNQTSKIPKGMTPAEAKDANGKASSNTMTFNEAVEAQIQAQFT